MPVQNLVGTLPAYSDTSNFNNAMDRSMAYSKSAREYRQRKLADALAAKYMKDDGNLDDVKYRSEAAKNGLGLPYISEADNYRTGQFANAQKQTEARASIAGVTGKDVVPVIGRASGGYGDPGQLTVTKTTNQDGSSRTETRDQQGNVVDVKEEGSWMRDIPADGGTQPTQESQVPAQIKEGNWFTNLFRAEQKPKPKFTSEFLPSVDEAGPEQMSNNLTPAQQEQVRLQQQAPSGAAVQSTQQTTPLDVGVGNLSVPSVNSLEPTTETSYIKLPDNRSYLSRAEDMPLRGELLDPLTGADSKTETVDDSKFKWTPVNAGNNQYTQFADGLRLKLQAYGLTKTKEDGTYDVEGNASDYLKNVYDSTLQKSITAPQPNPTQLQLGPAGRAKYNEERLKYNADVARARGEADAAVIAAKEGLSQYAKEQGVNTVEDRKTQLTGNVRVKNEADFDAASALAENRGFTRKILADIDAAGDNVATLTSILPQLARGMATAWSPGQQITDGNLKENVGTLYNGLRTENGQPVDESVKTALARLFMSGGKDTGGFQDLTNRLDATSVQVLKQRMESAAKEAIIVSDNRYKHYTTDTSEYVDTHAKPTQKPANQKTEPKPVKRTAADDLGIGKKKTPTKQETKRVRNSLEDF